MKYKTPFSKETQGIIESARTAIENARSAVLTNPMPVNNAYRRRQKKWILDSLSRSAHELKCFAYVFPNDTK